MAFKLKPKEDLEEEDLKSTGMRSAALSDLKLGELKACDMQYIFTFSSAEEALIYFQKPCINVLHAWLLCIVIDDGNMDCRLVKDIVENLDLAIMVLEVYVKILQLIVLFILRPLGGTEKRANVVAGNNRSEMLTVNWRL